MATRGSEGRIQDSAQNWFHFSLAGQCQGSPIRWRTQLGREPRGREPRPASHPLWNTSPTQSRQQVNIVENIPH